MNKFELFTMIYYVLDAEWEVTHSDTLGDFLSSMDPFLFDGIDSADSAIYSDFCSLINEEITIKNSYDLALRYIAWLDDEEASRAFSIGRDQWLECVRVYLSEPHKGDDVK